MVDAGVGIAHVEKNWGLSFPQGWIWLQAFSKSEAESPHKARTFSMAGGKTLGQKAYLLGYRSENLQWSFRPPFTLMPFGFATPFVAETFDSKMGTAHFEVCSLMRKLVVEVESPSDHDGWLGLACPLKDGHGNTSAYETFEGDIRVKAYQRGWGFWGWNLVEDTTFEHAAVEFGGDYSFKVVKK